MFWISIAQRLRSVRVLLVFFAATLDAEHMEIHMTFCDTKCLLPCVGFLFGKFFHRCFLRAASLTTPSLVSLISFPVGRNGNWFRNAWLTLLSQKIKAVLVSLPKGKIFTTGTLNLLPFEVVEERLFWATKITLTRVCSARKSEVEVDTQWKLQNMEYTFISGKAAFRNRHPHIKAPLHRV